MSKLPATYTVEAFLDNNRNRIWRIEWFGQVDLNPQVPSEPTIEVVLVPTRDAEIDPQTIKQKSAYQHSARRITRVGVGLLPCLHIGTLWRGGHQLDTPSYTLGFFDELLITPETSHITDARRAPSLITTKYYPSATSRVRAKYLVIDLDQARHHVDEKSKLIIPCVEVARFYYMNSTPLTRSIVGGGLSTQANDVYAPNKTRLPGTDGIGFIQLRDIIKDADRRIVARCAFDLIANRNARNIHTSIIRNAVNEGCAVLEARPPFERTTDLTVQGKWIRSSDGIWHFLVYRIVSCTAPFPFEQLNWARDNDGTPAGDHDPSRPVAYEGAIKTPVCPTEREEGDRLITNTEEPSLDYEVTDIELDHERFPDLRNKNKGIKIRNTENHTRAGDVRPNGPEAIDTFSTGAGHHNENIVAPVSVTQHERRQTEEPGADNQRARQPARFANFSAILSKLENLAGITTSLVFLDAADENSEVKCCTYFPILFGRRPLTWSYLNYEQRQRRQAMIGHCRYNNTNFYLFDIEVREDDDNDRYSMLLLNDSRLLEVGAGRLRAVLTFAAERRGRWIQDWELKNLEKETFKHDLKDATKHARRFFDYMQSKVVGVIAQVASDVPLIDLDESRNPGDEATVQGPSERKKIAS
ncbi:MAG TPA: hypothetical protein VF525_16585 [Pyrinomonadaceae bacterium]|jgi:hypothetical protein